MRMTFEAAMINIDVVQVDYLLNILQLIRIVCSVWATTYKCIVNIG